MLDNGHFASLLSGALTANNIILEMSKNIINSNRLKYDREIFTLSDGGKIAIDLNPDRAKDRISKKPLLVIFPGFLSTIEDHYHHTLIHQAVENEYDWVFINYRGLN